MTRTEVLNLLNSGLKSGKLSRVLSENGIRLSTMGWSEYYVLNGQLMYHHHFGDNEYTEVVSSIDEISLFNEEAQSPFEYSQEITSEIAKALKAIINK